MKTVFIFNFKGDISVAYNTRQKEAVLACLREHSEGHVHAADIAEYLAKAGEKVGLTTIYRQLDKLVEEGVVKKFVTEGSSACYQYVGDGHCGEHFHLKCESCGKLIHLKCRTFDKLSAHILEEHGFLSDPGRTTLYGTCGDCRAKGAKQ